MFRLTLKKVYLNQFLEMDKRTADIYAQMNPYKALVNKTSGFIQWALNKVKDPYLACSFGKDSGVMLHLVLQQLPNIPVIFISRKETNLVDNYKEVIAEWGNLNIHEINFMGNTLDFVDKSVIKTAIEPIKQNFDSFFVGLRAEEAVGRRITLRHHGNFYKMKDGLVRICPLAHWSTRDIATYCLSNNLPTLNKYKIEGFDARTTAGISSKTPHESLAYVKQNNISDYNKILELLPEAKYFI